VQSVTQAQVQAFHQRFYGAGRAEFGAAGDMPAYRAVLDRGGKAGPEDTAVLGDEETVAKELKRFADAGTTEFLVCPVGTDSEVERTTRFALDYATAQQ